MNTDLLKILFEAEVRKQQREGVKLDDALEQAGEKLKKNIVDSKMDSYIANMGDR